MLDAVGEVGGITALGDQFQVLHALADGDAELMGVDDAGKGNANSLSGRGFDQEIFIAGEQHAAKLPGTVE